MRILVTGAAGMIGKKLSRCLCESSHQVIPIDIVQHDEAIFSADLRDRTTVFQLIKIYMPDLILHLASNKDLYFCEKNKAVSRATNYGITKVLAQVCSEFEIRMIFFSSDYVFGKYDRFWQENDRPCPTTQYGVDKADSELFIQQQLSDYAIIRTAQLYGLPNDLVSLVCKTLTSHQAFLAFANLINCPTWFADLFTMLKKIIDHGHQGIFHCVGSEAISRYQYAYEIAKTFALDTSYIQAVDLDFSTDIRPPVVRLNGALTYDILQHYPKNLKDNLTDIRHCYLK